MTKGLVVKNVLIKRDGTVVVNDVSFVVRPGELCALLGPNGSGKSSVANALAGHPNYEIAGGAVTIDGEDIVALKPDARSKRGLFLSLQYPPEIPGVSVSSFLRMAVNARREKSIGVLEFRDLLKEKMSSLGIDVSFSGRGLNEGFSGGEKKKMEMLQMAVLSPSYAILDETDSGLDVDAQKIVARGIAAARAAGVGVVLITHSTPFLRELSPDAVHVMSGGSIVRQGGAELLAEIEARGFGAFGAMGSVTESASGTVPIA